MGYKGLSWFNHVSPFKLCPDRSLTGTVVVFPTSHLFNVDLVWSHILGLCFWIKDHHLNIPQHHWEFTVCGKFISKTWAKTFLPQFLAIFRWCEQNKHHTNTPLPCHPLSDMSGVGAWKMLQLHYGPKDMNLWSSAVKRGSHRYLLFQALS